VEELQPLVEALPEPKQMIWIDARIISSLGPWNNWKNR